MEPILTSEGYQALQNSKESRDLLNSYYRKQGYEVVAPKTSTYEEEKETAVPQKSKKNSASRDSNE